MYHNVYVYIAIVGTCQSSKSQNSAIMAKASSFSARCFLPALEIPSRLDLFGMLSLSRPSLFAFDKPSWLFDRFSAKLKRLPLKRLGKVAPPLVFPPFFFFFEEESNPGEIIWFMLTGFLLWEEVSSHVAFLRLSIMIDLCFVFSSFRFAVWKFEILNYLFCEGIIIRSFFFWSGGVGLVLCTYISYWWLY